jgi:hypothetical protein
MRDDAAIGEDDAQIAPAAVVALADRHRRCRALLQWRSAEVRAWKRSLPERATSSETILLFAVLTRST